MTGAEGPAVFKVIEAATGLYEMIVDLWDRSGKGNREAMLSLAAYLREIAKTLRGAKEKFKKREIPYEDGHRLEGIFNAADMLASKYKQERHVLARIFDVQLVELGKRLRAADFFIGGTEGPKKYLLHYPSRGPAVDGFTLDKLGELCDDLERAVGDIEAVAMTLEQDGKRSRRG